MINLFRFFVRISAFLRKEIFEVLRQPRLILILVLGPFLVLLLFGIGYRAEAQPVRTLFVMERDSTFRLYIEEYVTALAPLLVFSGITDDLEQGKELLRRGEVDVVVALPEDAFETIRNSEQALFTLYHNEIDPVVADSLRVFGRVYVDEVNRRILRAVTQQGQSEASLGEDVLGEARTSATAMREALERGDNLTAEQEQRDLVRSANALDLALGASLSLLGNVEQTTGTSDDESSVLVTALSDVRQDVNALEETGGEGSNPGVQAQKVAVIEEDLAELETALSDFRQIEPGVLVSPFRSETQSIAAVAPKLSEFFAPAVIVLLLQHLAITFAALSIVRERTSGTMELFRVSPLSAMETLLGKYGSYLIFEGVLAAILTALVVLGLRVPLLGSWIGYSLAIAALIFTALGAGFVISGVADTDSQAVQYSMFALLASVFFSGFFLNLDYLWAPVRTISWLLPATFGIRLLQNIMLRGEVIDLGLLANLAAIGFTLFLFAWLLLHRRMAQS